MLIGSPCNPPVIEALYGLACLFDHNGLTEILNIVKILSTIVDTSILRFAWSREDESGKRIGSID